MKQVNFITTLTPQQQYEIRRWFIGSLIISITTIITIICYFTPQLYALYTIKKEIAALKIKTKDYTVLTNAKISFKKEYEIIQQKLQSINRYIFSPKSPHVYINSIMSACNAIKIETIRNNEQNIELIILCPSTEQATMTVQSLHETGHLINIKINSLQYDSKNNEFRCIIKGNIKESS